MPKQNQITMKKATLTIELNGNVFTKQTYSYRKAESIVNRLKALTEYYKGLPNLSNANFVISL